MTVQIQTGNVGRMRKVPESKHVAVIWYVPEALPPSLSLLWIVTCGADVSSQPSVSMDECQGNQIWFKWVSLPVCPLTLHAHIRQHKEPTAIIYLGNTWTCAYVNGQHVGWAEKFSTEMTSWMGTQSNHTVTNCPPLSLQGHANLSNLCSIIQSPWVDNSLSGSKCVRSWFEPLTA